MWLALVRGLGMSFISIEFIVAAIVIVNVILLAASLRLGKSQPKLSLEDLLSKIPERADTSKDKN